MWNHVYDPLGSPVLSTIAAAVPVVTLLVTPDDATKLTMATAEVKIQLALRNTIDIKKADPPPVLQTALFSTGAAPVVRNRIYAKAAPAAPPRSPPTPPI